MRGHAQLRNSLTTGMLKNEVGGSNRYNQGIWIDIFPLDDLPDDLEERERFLKKLHFRRWMSDSFHRRMRLDSHEGESRKRIIVGKIVAPVARCLDRVFNIQAWLYRRYEKLFTIYARKGAKEVGWIVLPTMCENWIWEKRYFQQKPIKVDFEMLKLDAPPDYDKILQKQYGDWHKFVMGGSYHGDVLFDPERPYTEYLRGKG